MGMLRVKTSQSLQQGIRFGIQFAGKSPSNSRKEVNQGPNEVGKEEDPQIDRPIQHENQLFGHSTRVQQSCLHVVAATVWQKSLERACATQRETMSV